MSNADTCNINNLINSLSDELEPVKKAQHPLCYTLPWLLMAAIFSVVVVRYIGVRYDVAEAMKSATFLFEAGAVTTLGISAAVTSAYLMVPDMRGKKWLLPVTYSIAGVFALWNVAKGYAEGVQMPQISFDHCMQEGLFMSFIPMMALIFFMRSGSTTKPKTMCFMNLLTGAAIAYVGLRFTCPMDTVGHTLIFHLTPYVAIGAVIGLGARRLYKW